MNANDEIDRLIAAFVDGTLTEADKEAFERAMREHPEALQRAADAVRFEIELTDAVSPGQIELVQERRVTIDRATGRPVKIESTHRVGPPTEPGVNTVAAKQKIRWWPLGIVTFILAAVGLWLSTNPGKHGIPSAQTANWTALPLKNPGFEVPDLGTNPTSSLEIQDWHDKFTTNLTQLLVTAPGEAQSGKQIVRIGHAGHIKQLLADTKGNAITFEPGLKVRVSGWAKPESPIVGKADVLHIALHYVDDALRQYVATYQILSLDGSGWRRFSLDFMVPAQETFEPSYKAGPSASIRGRPVLLSITNLSYQTSPKSVFFLDDMAVEIIPPQATPETR